MGVEARVYVKETIAIIGCATGTLVGNDGTILIDVAHVKQFIVFQAVRAS